MACQKKKKVDLMEDRAYEVHFSFKFDLMVCQKKKKSWFDMKNSEYEVHNHKQAEIMMITKERNIQMRAT